jgi:aspartate/methionine/tyrosine aminotransferase
VKPAKRLDGIELSLIRQINALATRDSINLGIGEPNIEPDETMRELARRATGVSWHYSPNAGNLSLRKLIASDPNQVCVTAGTEEGLYSIFQAYVDPGDEVLVPDPGFVSYATIAKIAGATVVTYPLEPPSWEIDVDALLQRVSSKTKLIIVNSPSNPLGSVVAKDVLQRIATAGPLVISDEVYREIWYDAPPPSMIGMGDNVIVVSGLSKSHSMTGLRLGWIVAQPDAMKPIITAHQYVATCASVFSQALAELIFRNEEWNASWLQRMRAEFSKQRETALFSVARDLEAEITPPAGAFYAFVPVPFCESLPFAKSLAEEANVLVIPGVAFGKRGEGFVRISYAAGVSEIGAGIERMGRYLSGRERR